MPFQWVSARVGWPVRAMETELYTSSDGTNVARGDWHIGHKQLRMLPTAPVWPGLLVNTLFYTAIVFALSLLPGVIRRWRRRRRGLCIACGYDLTSTGDACPECGAGPLVRSPSAANRAQN